MRDRLSALRFFRWPAGWLAHLSALVSLSASVLTPSVAAAQDAWVFTTAMPCASAPVYGLPFSQCWASNTRAFRNGKVQSWRLTFSDAKSEIAVGLYRVVEAQGGGGMSAVAGSGAITWLQSAEALKPVTAGGSDWASSGDYVTFRKGQRQCIGFVRNGPNWILGGALCRESQAPIAASEAQFIADAVRVRD